MGALLKEDFTDKQLPRGDLHETPLQSELIIAANFSIL